MLKVKFFIESSFIFFIEPEKLTANDVINFAGFENIFFGESLLYMDTVEYLLQNCDLFLSVGTSGVVYPAAGFVQVAYLNGARTCEFNLEKTSNNYMFAEHIEGPAGKTLPAFVDELLKK